MALLQTLHNASPMHLTSFSFLYVYLPVSLLAYYLAPKAVRKAVLLIVSLGFAALSGIQFFPLFLMLAAADFILARVAASAASLLQKRVCLWLCIIKSVAVIMYFGVGSQFGISEQPVWYLVYSLSSIDAALAAYKEENSEPLGFIDFMLYLSFFPRLYAGPLVTCGAFCGQLVHTEIDRENISTGFGRFVQGIFKYAVLGGGLFSLYKAVRLIPEDSVTVLSAWSLVAALALAFYFTLAGLADAARGIAGLFGLQLPQNFYYPYQSRSVTDFLERFNMSVGAFLKRAVYDPLCSGKDDPVADSINIMLVGMLWGLWYGVRGGFILWGAFIAAFIIFERYFYPRLLMRLPTLFCRGYALLVTLAGFAIFSGDSLSQSGNYVMAMLGIGGVAALNGRILYLLSSNWLLLSLSFVLSFNAVNLLAGLLRKMWPRVSAIVSAAVNLLILVLFTALSSGGMQI